MGQEITFCTATLCPLWVKSGHSATSDLGSEPIAMSPADFGKLLADETEKWAKVIRTENIKPE